MAFEQIIIAIDDVLSYRFDPPLQARDISVNLTWLKIAAMAAMLFDHGAVAYLRFFPHSVLDVFLRMPGRISIPVFTFLVAYGYERFTTDRVGYALRLWLFAALSEPVFIAFFGSSGNALIPLALGATILFLGDSVKGRRVSWVVAVGSCLAVLFYVRVTGQEEILPMTLLVIMFHRVIRHGNWVGWAVPVVLTVIVLNKPLWQYYVMVSVSLGLIVLVLNVRSGMPGVRLGRWGGYLFYPGHLLGLVGVVKLVG